MFITLVHAFSLCASSIFVARIFAAASVVLGLFTQLN